MQKRFPVSALEVPENIKTALALSEQDGYTVLYSAVGFVSVAVVCSSAEELLPTNKKITQYLYRFMRDKRFLRAKRAKKPILSGFCPLWTLGKHCLKLFALKS